MFRTLTRQIVGLLIGAALTSIAVAPAHAGQITLSGLTCSSLVIGGAAPNWTVACTSMTCSLTSTSFNPAPGSLITLTATCDSGANSYAFATTTPAAGCNTPIGGGASNTATATEDQVRNCTYQVTGTNPSQIQGQASVAIAWSVGAPPLPTGCIASGSPTSFTTAGGTINLSASCATPASGIVWSWKRNGVAGWSAAQNPSDVLPANGGSVAVTYTYQATACNGASCVTITPPVSASVAGTGGGGGAITCPGFENTVTLDIDWNQPVRTLTGNLGPNDAVVVRFRTGPNNTTPYSSVTGAEMGSLAAARFATLATAACEFREPPPLGWSATSYGSTVFLKFTVGPNPTHFYPELQPNTQYFVNVRTNPGQCTTCNMYFDLHK